MQLRQKAKAIYKVIWGVEHIFPLDINKPEVYRMYTGLFTTPCPSQATYLLKSSIKQVKDIRQCRKLK